MNALDTMVITFSPAGFETSWPGWEDNCDSEDARYNMLLPFGLKA
jgi:hypothetical protein